MAGHAGDRPARPGARRRGGSRWRRTRSSGGSGARRSSGRRCARARPGPTAPATGLGPEEPDPDRTCFERDRDRILHSAAFRRLAGKTQVFVFPADHQRTRLTHALEVAQVATGIARAAGLNAALTEAIALGHDCGHGPGGHASEEAFDAFLPEGYDHAVWGADVVLAPLNLCARDARRHPQPLLVPPGAGHARGRGRQLGRPDRLLRARLRGRRAGRASSPPPTCRPRSRRSAGATPPRAAGHLHRRRGRGASSTTGVVGMAAEPAAALAALRPVQLRAHLPPAGVGRPVRGGRRGAAGAGRALRRATRAPARAEHRPSEREPDPVRAAVAYVAGMTDRFAFDTAARELGWPAGGLPRGIDVGVAE